jgi:DNA-binding transcriptional regulator YiaG
MEITNTELNADFRTGDFRNSPSDQSLFSASQFLTAAMASCLIGPGAVFCSSVSNAAQLPDTNMAATYASEISDTPGNPAENLLTSIREGWNLNMTELATILNSTRPTLYNWLRSGLPVNAQKSQHLQTLAVAAEYWKSYLADGGKDFLLDYTGPKANEESIRQAMSRSEVTTEELRCLIELRKDQYKLAYEVSREILGAPLPIPASSPPENSHRLQELWEKNSNNLNRFRHSRD